MKARLLFFLSFAIIIGISCSKDDEVSPDSKNNTEIPKDSVPSDTTPVSYTYEGNLSNLKGDRDTMHMYVRYKNFNSPLLISVILSDLAEKGGETVNDQLAFEELETFTATNQNQAAKELWDKYQCIIHYANRILFNKELNQSDDSLRYKAEASFYRAFTHFQMIKFYGNVPKMDFYWPLDSSMNVSANQEKVFELILSDLEFAAQNLPNSNTQTMEELFLPGKTAAQALAGKVCLYMASNHYLGKNEYYTKAANYFNEVISSGQHMLIADFALNFEKEGEFSSEGVFEINYKVEDGNVWFGDLHTFSNADAIFMSNRAGYLMYNASLGWGFAPVSLALKTLFESEGDSIRKNGTLFDFESVKDNYSYNSYNHYQYTGFYSNKTCYKEGNIGTGYNYGNNDMIIRYSDVLLMYAEVCLQTGNTQEALTAFNQVRERVGLAHKANISMDDIIIERQLELALEGHRFFDLVRWGKAAEVLADKNFSVGTHEHLPIPESALLQNKGLVQNSGY
jgi:hypothetical protein